MMRMILEIIFWASIFLIGYTYVLYPLFLFAVSRIRKPLPVSDPADWPGVSIVVAAYNEEKVIEKRVRNCLAMDYPRDRLEVLIASDGSEDRTGEIVRRFEHEGVRFLDYKERRGKVNVLNDTVPQTKHGIVVFSDANTLFEHDAVRKLVRAFGNARVGCVCGRLKFVNAEGSCTAELEGVYWKFETFLKTVEGAHGSLLGANGGIFAIRKELFYPCPPDTIVEDFVLPMKILEKGFRVMYEPAALAVEEAAKHIIQEKQRRIRIGAGDFQALFMLLPLLHPSRGFPALAFWSHKAVRWFVPFFLILAFVSNFILIDYDDFYRVTLFMQCMFYLCACFGQVLSWIGVQNKLFSLCYYFVSMNIALFLGFWKFVAGQQKVTWQRTER